MNFSVDLNADLGEGFAHDAELFEFISSASIATGFHAGDADTMHAAVSGAKTHGVAVGAHPSFFDRENFGRKELKISPEEVCKGIVYQLGIFQAIATAAGMQPNHVKPHGALYNMAVRDGKLANAIARAIRSVDSIDFVCPGQHRTGPCRRGAGVANCARSFCRPQLSVRWMACSAYSSGCVVDRSG